MPAPQIPFNAFQPLQCALSIIYEIHPLLSPTDTDFLLSFILLPQAMSKRYERFKTKAVGRRNKFRFS